MQGLVEESEITETDMSYPEASSGRDGGEYVGADQKPEQVMMDELGQGTEGKVTAIAIHLFMAEHNGGVASNFVLPMTNPVSSPDPTPDTVLTGCSKTISALPHSRARRIHDIAAGCSLRRLQEPVPV